MYLAAFVLGLVACLAAAFQWSHSTSGFLVLGLGGAALLLRAGGAWHARLGWFVVGTLGSYLMRFGVVSWGEAAHRGVILSLSALLVAVVSRNRLPARIVSLCFLGFLIPVIIALHPLHTVPKRTPAAQGLAFEDVQFTTADGLTLGGWLVPAAEARGNVIFCHGHGRNRGHVVGILPTLHAQGFNVLALDFRGHGMSAGHTSTFGHREVQDLVAAELYLRERYPGRPLFLVGVSLGAAVSLQALPYLPNVRGVWSEGAYSTLAGVVGHQFEWLPGWMRRPVLEVYDGIALVDCGFRYRDVQPIRDLQRVAVPIYFCHGCADELVPLTEGQALYDSYRGPKQCWWVENASHYDVRQRNRDEYLLRLRQFLEDCLAP